MNWKNNVGDALIAYAADSTDDNWENCVTDANNILEKYKKHPLARGIMTHTIMQLEHTVNGRTLAGLDREQWEIKLNNEHKMGW